MASVIKAAPEGVAFYYPKDPADLEGEHGTVIWHRPLTVESAIVKPEGASTPRWRNELVLYRSRDVRGNPIAVSGIVVLPDTPPPAGGSYPVISWAHGTVGSADPTAPSRDEDEKSKPMNAYPHVLLRAFLEKGWAVVMTDYEGLGTEGPHPYQLGESEARGILDIVRAARQIFPEIGHCFQIVGHSQGGQAALFGAHHAPSWTPELDFRGVVAVAPSSSIVDLVVGASQHKETPFDGYAFPGLFLTGAMGGDPTIDPRELLSDRAYEVFPHLERYSRGRLSESDSWGGLVGTDIFNPRQNPSKSKFFRQLERMHPALPIEAPVRIVQAAADTRVLAVNTRKLVDQLVFLNGDLVEYELYELGSGVPIVPDLGVHFGTIKHDIERMIPWLEGHFSRP
ncbi:alpha/beta fold hydrolase [Polyangium spumosum]|uniref:Alpha/beta fold hydrolase n=1 Tax=Polyangium spumosum TaxID=889282 RepID=A0A6N7Q190_9BACT|nr:alpha/beta fold hydrolase [Polyangium spumosum]MRG98078.1 alpha/beta fold hydrolase [Polyangium spumosum]